MANILIQRFGQTANVWKRITKGTFLLDFCQNIGSEIAVNLNFHFSHSKSLEILSCDSNQST